MVHVETEVIIKRAVDVVAPYVCDPDTTPLWCQNVRSVAWVTTAGKVQVGARVAFVAYFLGRRLSLTYEVVEYLPRARMVVRATDGPFPWEAAYTFTAVDDGEATHVRRVSRGQPSGFAKVAEPMLAVAVRRSNEKDLATLKALLE